MAGNGGPTCFDKPLPLTAIYARPEVLTCQSPCAKRPETRKKARSRSRRRKCCFIIIIKAKEFDAKQEVIEPAGIEPLG
jgi:hypothetical protein